MKTPILFALALLLGSPAFAKSAPHQAKTNSKSVSLAQLKKEVQALADDLANADGCQFSVRETRTGITLSVQDEKKTSAFLDVSETTPILMDEETVSADGSYAHTFRVTGEGSIRVIRADDAFESVDLTDRDGRTLSCELDI